MELKGSVLLDSSGDRVGLVVDVLIDPASQQPRWLQVGVDGWAADADVALVPAAAASEVEPGVLMVAYDAATVRSARCAASRSLAAVDADRLAALYGFPAEHDGETS